MASGNFWRQMRTLNKAIVKNYRHGFRPGKLILLLTTTGRKSGLARETPLQYEEIDRALYVASARGPEADWFKNVLEESRVQVQIGELVFTANAQPILDPEKIADFLALRLRSRPIMFRLIMCLFEGLPWQFDRQDLVKFAAKKAVLKIPRGGNDEKTRHKETV